jgi:hypothetical protein
MHVQFGYMHVLTYDEHTTYSERETYLHLGSPVLEPELDLTR